MKLYNEKIILLPYEQDMWPFVYAWQNSGKYDYFFGNFKPMNSNEISDYISRAHQVFAIADSKNIKNIIGLCCIDKFNDRNRNAHFYVLIDEKMQRQGIAFDATIMLIDYMLNEMNLYKAICEVCARNTASVNGVEKIGMAKEGDFKYDAYYDGQFCDIYRYCITKSIFNKNYKKSVKEKIS